jgi:glycosyltransferase involved in cell wall biosynthesis
LGIGNGGAFMRNVADAQLAEELRTRSSGRSQYHVAVVTSIHPNFDSRIWKHAQSVARLGYRTTLVCPWDVPEGEVRRGVTFKPFEPIRSRAKRSYQIPARVLGALRPILSDVDLIHFHDLDLLPWMAFLSLGKQVIYDCHENYPEGILTKTWIPKPIRYPAAWSVRLSQFTFSRIIGNIVLVTSVQLRDFSARVHKLFLYNYASGEMSNNVSDDYNSRTDGVIFTGSQYEENGSLLVLEVADRLRNRLPNVQFYVPDRFYDLNFRARYVAEIEARNLGKTMILYPNMLPHELIKMLNRATIAVAPNLRLPSQENLVPTKLFEYMAAGLPIVSSDLPTATRVVAENDSGILANPEDPETFVNAIVRLVEDRAMARRLGQNGRRAFAEKYSWETQDSNLDQFYISILTKKPESFSQNAGVL